MIYQPRNVYPMAKAIDATLENTFEMEVQTNNYVSGYQLFFTDFENNSVYNGTKQNLSERLYNSDTLKITVAPNTITNGNNYKWRVKLYQDVSDMLITYGKVQLTGSTTKFTIQPNINVKVGMTIKIGTQSRVISAYDLDTYVVTVNSAFSTAPTFGEQYYVYSDFIETIPDFVVYARKTPTVNISNVPTTLNTKSMVFQGTYSQSDNIPMSYHQFDLYVQVENNKWSLLDTTGRVYSANLKYEYDAFRTKNTYRIQMTVENDLGVVATTEMFSFNVQYDVIEYLQQPVARMDVQQDAINISWVAPIEHIGAEIFHDSGNETMANYLQNVPYDGVNSLYNDSTVNTIWQSSEGLAEMPSNYNITLQFSPDKNFYYGGEGNYNNLQGVVKAELEDGSIIRLQVNGKNLRVIDNANNIRTVPFYTNTTDSFVLSKEKGVVSSYDYVWKDNEVWDDNSTWVEGGTPLNRICDKWWKVRITNNSIQLQQLFTQ